MNNITIDYLLNASNNILTNSGITTARIDSLVLLEDITQKDRSWLLAHSDHNLTRSKVSKLKSYIERRAKHEPLAYIRGKSEFYGREFEVTPDTLQPRPESETIIVQLLEVLGSRSNVLENCTVIDVGTGSGCLAITTKLEIPNLNVIATDISASALKIARRNSKKFGVDLTICQGNLLEPITLRQLKNSILLCNLPYVPDSHTINQAAMHEPNLAIFGGADGLDLYRQLFDQITDRSTIGQFKIVPHVITECLPPQHNTLEIIASKAGYHLAATDDFIQVFTKSA